MGFDAVEKGCDCGGEGGGEGGLGGCEGVRRGELEMLGGWLATIRPIPEGKVDGRRGNEDEMVFAELRRKRERNEEREFGSLVWL